MWAIVRTQETEARPRARTLPPVASAAVLRPDTRRDRRGHPAARPSGSCGDQVTPSTGAVVTWRRSATLTRVAREPGGLRPVCPSKGEQRRGLRSDRLIGDQAPGARDWRAAGVVVRTLAGPRGQQNATSTQPCSARSHLLDRPCIFRGAREDGASP